MDAVVIGLTALHFLFCIAQAYAVFHIVQWLLCMVNQSRSDAKLKPWTDRFIFGLALASALAILI